MCVCVCVCIYHESVCTQKTLTFLFTMFLRSMIFKTCLVSFRINNCICRRH